MPLACRKPQGAVIRHQAAHALVAIFLGLMWLAGWGWQLNAAEAGKPLLLAHYMPWYATKDFRGQWGWHWTMDHFDPDRVGWAGQREAASHEYPLIGLYDSADPQALECQVLLMKFAGIDGVIVDWYGTEDFGDYAMIHRNTEALVSWLKKAGLRLAICYEDQAVGKMVQGKVFDPENAVAHGKLAVEWLDTHWFGDECYVKQDGRPVLLVFGPRYFVREQQWRELRLGLASRPLIYALPHVAAEAGADGLFAWPPVSGGKVTAPEAWRKELDLLPAASATGVPSIPVSFPSFHDVYQEAGVSASYGRIEGHDGKTFAETLELTQKRGAPLTQIATWNDYGEGTVIEPTRNNGYRYLEMTQQRARAQDAHAMQFTCADLRLPVALYELRKRCGGDAETSAALDRAAELLLASRCGEAEKLLDEIGKRLSQRPAIFADFPVVADAKYRLATDIVYREGDDLTDAMKQRCRLDVYYPAGRKDFATVVWFHGGGLTQGERFIPVPLRNKGVAVVAVNYRLSPGAESPVYIEDAAAAMAWTFHHIAEYGGSPAAIFASGHSAGGYLASMITLDKQWLGVHGIDANRLAGVVPFSGQMITHMTIRKERGIDEKQPVVDALAPLYHVRKDAPPILIITGDRELEMLGRYEENAYFWRMLKVAGHRDNALREMSGFDHGRMPEPGFPLLLEFMRGHVGENSGR